MRMVQKRSLVGEELSNSYAKHLKLAIGAELFPVLEFVPPEPALKTPSTSEDLETSDSGQLLVSSWTTSAATVGGDVSSAAAFRGYFSDENVNLSPPIRTFVSPEEVCPSLWVRSSQKSVPIGKDHQADIPTWGTHGTADTSNYLDSSEPIVLLSKDPGLELSCGSDDENRLMGACVIPMPDSEQSTEDGHDIGNGRTGCSCLDSGSLRCVRKHIMEERAKLKRTLGREKFLELGFGDMGEEVAEKWSDEEGQAFHDVIFSNPASVGKNFWGTLTNVFPYRTKKDIVNYYFNVFMLRRRAEQNRCRSMNIDSDDDEWQRSDDYSDDEPEVEEEDEDSVVEYTLYEDDPGYKQNLEDYVQEYDEDGTGRTCYNESVDSGCIKDVGNILGTYAGSFVEIGDSDRTIQFSEKTLWEEKVDHDVQEESCTSSDTGPAAKGTRVVDENSDHWPCHFKGLSNVVGHGYVLEPCDAKVWESGFMTCPRYKNDFLPTYSVIEEVFGDIDWNLKENDTKGSW